MSQHRRHSPGYTTRERSIGRLALTLAGLILVTAGTIVTWLFLADRDLLFASPTAQTDATEAPTMARYRFDTVELIAPTRLVTRVKKPTLGNISKLDMLLPWEYQAGTVPKLPADAAEFNDWLILTLDTVGQDELSPVERYGEVYPVYFDGEPKLVDGNLLQYQFKQGSPYADLVLYVANADGKHVVHSCDKKKSVLGPILCERTIQMTPQVRLRIRFARKHLDKWAEIEANVRRAMASMLHNLQPG